MTTVDIRGGPPSKSRFQLGSRRVTGDFDDATRVPRPLAPSMFGPDTRTEPGGGEPVPPLMLHRAMLHRASSNHPNSDPCRRLPAVLYFSLAVLCWGPSMSLRGWQLAA